MESLRNRVNCFIFDHACNIDSMNTERVFFPICKSFLIPQNSLTYCKYSCKYVKPLPNRMKTHRENVFIIYLFPSIMKVFSDTPEFFTECVTKNLIIPQ